MFQPHPPRAGEYDMKLEKELTGPVKSIKVVNPNGTLTITVKNQDGTPVDWTVTMGSATGLAGKNVGPTGPNALHFGDTIKIKFIPAANGSPLGFLKTVTYADGHVIVISAG